jgi:hypothetical protein
MAVTTYEVITESGVGPMFENLVNLCLDPSTTEEQHNSAMEVFKRLTPLLVEGYLARKKGRI